MRVTWLPAKEIHVCIMVVILALRARAWWWKQREFNPRAAGGKGNLSFCVEDRRYSLEQVGGDEAWGVNLIDWSARYFKIKYLILVYRLLCVKMDFLGTEPQEWLTCQHCCLILQHIKYFVFLLSMRFGIKDQSNCPSGTSMGTFLLVIVRKYDKNIWNKTCSFD